MFESVKFVSMIIYQTAFVITRCQTIHTIIIYLKKVRTAIVLHYKKTSYKICCGQNKW